MKCASPLCGEKYIGFKYFSMIVSFLFARSFVRSFVAAFMYAVVVFLFNIFLFVCAGGVCVNVNESVCSFLSEHAKLNKTVKQKTVLPNLNSCK